MLLKIYKILNIILSPLIILIITYRIYKKKEDVLRVSERFGFASRTRPKGKLLWIHAASIGETISALPFIDACNKDLGYKIMLTTGTVTSARIAKNNLPKGVIHQYVPIENYFAIRKFLSHWKPDLAVFIEAEFWPCLSYETSRICKIISLNTRISDSAYKNWAYFKALLRTTLRCFAVFMPQSLEDKDKLESLGFKNVKHIGNLKYSVPSLPCNLNELSDFKSQIKNKIVVLFASTHAGEEELISKIYNKVQDPNKSLLFVIVPRHPIRSNKVYNYLQQNGYESILLSENKPITNTTEFYIIDAIGKLGLFFRLAPITVIGGTFVEVGGHNPIEAARLKSAVIIGPHSYNFKEICNDFKRAHAAIFVKNSDECIKAIKTLWQDKNSYNTYVENASTLVKKKERILEDTIAYIKKIL